MGYNIAELIEWCYNAKSIYGYYKINRIKFQLFYL